MGRVYVFLADGFEEIEGLTVVDLLRRAEIDVATVSVMGKQLVTGSHKITLYADSIFEEQNFADAELLVLPGGMPGALNLKNHAGLAELLKNHCKSGKKAAAICAAPGVLGELGLLSGRKAVCYPGFEEQLQGAEILKEKVVVDQNITTSRGMGTAIDFALSLIKQLSGTEKAEKIAQSILF